MPAARKAAAADCLGRACTASIWEDCNVDEVAYRERASVPCTIAIRERTVGQIQPSQRRSTPVELSSTLPRSNEMKLWKLAGTVAVASLLGPPAFAADAVKIGFITKFPVPFYTTMADAAKAYATAHPGVDIIYGQGKSATDIEGQIALIESMVTQGVKGIALTPVDPTVAPALDKAVAAGVKVVLMDNSIPNWKGATALATTDNLAAGKLAGEYLKSKLKSGDTMGILEGVPGVPALDDRVKGMMEGLKGVDVKIVGRGATKCTEELGLNVAEDILTKNPEVKSIYSACGPPAAGAAQAIKNAGKVGKVILVGFDFCCGEKEALTAGIENATVAQFPSKMAELGVDALIRSIHGDKVDSLIDSGAALVTKDNMDTIK
jgi:ABC-type sugar transport system substrate-binding protein